MVALKPIFWQNLSWGRLGSDVNFEELTTCSHLNVEHNEQKTADINYAACGAFPQKYFRNLQYYRPVMLLLTPHTCFNYFWPNSVQVET